MAAASPDTTLKRTPLFDRHAEAGAKLVPFAGWEMPVQYEGVGAEHLAVRSTCGIFDVSHMGEIEVSGPAGRARSCSACSPTTSTSSRSAAPSTASCAHEQGGVLDDLFTYRLAGDHYLTVTNASNHEKDLAWFRRQAERFDAR